MNTRTIQVTMFKCDLCPYLRIKMAVDSSCICPDVIDTHGNGKVISTRICYPDIPDWCPLPKDTIKVF